MVFQPPGMTEAELMTGLRANIPRVEAQRILLMARAFQIAQPDSGDKAADLMKLAEVSGEVQVKSQVQEWFDKQKGRRSTAWPSR